MHPFAGTGTMRGNEAMARLLVNYGLRVRHRGQEQVHSWLRRVLRVQVRGPAAVERGGFKWILSPSDFVQTRLFWFGDYDPWDVYHLATFLPPGGVLFDVGANFGYYSVLLSCHVGTSGQVHAFEPYPSNAERLRTHVTLNGLENTVRISEIALSDTSGEAVMGGREDNSGAAYLAGGNANGVVVGTITLDGYCAAAGVVPHVMKLDVEGAEERVLRGGVETLSCFRPVILTELNPPTLSRAGSSVERVAAFLKGLGYELFVAKRKRLVPLTCLPVGEQMVNTFALPRN